jgi:23S rRNA pseudouridine1911/1915/1917 synthase
VTSLKTSTLNPEILFQDQDLLVINKPAGVVVNDAQSVVGERVQSWMRARLEQSAGDIAEDKSSWADLVPADFDDSYGTPELTFSQRAGMVHRLDKNTSGILVLAKNPGSLVNLLAQFRLRQVQKKYTCLVHGKVDPEEGVLDFPIGRARKDRKKFAVVIGGRPAQTSYQLEEYFEKLDRNKLIEANPAVATDPNEFFRQASRIYQGFSLVTCAPHTGRTHQIRVHLAHIQHPLVGDVNYVGKKRAKLDPVWCPRHFLHASQIELTHPRSGEPLQIKAELAEDLQAVLAVVL